MAYIAGAGSIITLLGSARAAVAIGFFKGLTGQEISFFGLSWYMAPLGWAMVFALWALIMVMFRPERAAIPGLRSVPRTSISSSGPILRQGDPGRRHRGRRGGGDEPALVHPGAVQHRQERRHPARDRALLRLRILEIGDLENIPWNIIPALRRRDEPGVLPGRDRAADWMAINTVAMLQNAPAIVFVLGMAFFVLMNDQPDHERRGDRDLPAGGAQGRALPGRRQRGDHVRLPGHRRHALHPAGRRRPHAIAYESRQFSSGEFFRAGLAASLLLMVILALFVTVIWPLMGMEVFVSATS